MDINRKYLDISKKKIIKKINNIIFLNINNLNLDLKKQPKMAAFLFKNDVNKYSQEIYFV